MKRVGFILVTLALLAMLVYAGENRTREIDIAHIVSGAGDSAVILRLNQFTPLDSFEYGGDIEGYGTALGEDSAYAWISGPQLARLIVTGPIDTTLVYRCSVDYGTNEYGFTYDVPEAEADTGVVKFIGVLVDSINNVADMSDTLQGEDSTTYVLIRSLYPQDELESGARWSVRVSNDGAGTELALGDSSYATILIVCDSVAAAINALDSISTKVTAANSGDTVITVTADTPGVAFTIDVADTAMDTTYTRGNFTSWSTLTDTLPLFSMTNPTTFYTLYGDVIILPSPTTTGGYGTLDTGKIWLEAYDGVNGFLTIDSTAVDGLPCTLHVSIPERRDSIGGLDPDTLWRDALRLIVVVSDSATRAVVVGDTANHKVQTRFNLR